MLNHKQNPFLDSFLYCFCLFGEFAKVFERQVWRVRVVHLHSAARALSSPSRYFQLSTNLVFACLCAQMLQQFSPTPEGYLYHVWFFHIVKLYLAKIKLSRSFDNSTNLYSSWLKKASSYNFADYFCCIHIFSAKLLICFQTFISLKHIQKLEILYEFDVHFHTKAR